MDLIKSIGSDDEVDMSGSSSEEETTASGKKPSYFNDDFEFSDLLEDYHVDPWQDLDKYLKKKRLSTTDQKISQVLQDGGGQEDVVEEDGGAEESDECEVDADGAVEAGRDAGGKLSDDLRVREDERRRKERKAERLASQRQVEDEKAGSFFTEITGEDVQAVKTFHEMNLSRPLLKALTSMQLVYPTPIQKTTIPVALLGRDICACAATGTGKTAAFMLPVLERLAYRPGASASSNSAASSSVTAATRVLVLVPTRELGAQVYGVARQLSQHLPGIQVALVAGGMDSKVQEAQLRRHPDIVIATPGRLIDHLQNTMGFCLDTVEVLVLDEADRMLDEYFSEQMTEIIRQCAATRQTMLFSATMTDDVRDLAAASLRQPVKIFVNENTDVAAKLKQEFIRIRPDREGDREAVVAALLVRTFKQRVMVFVQTKRQTHRLHVLLGLLGVKVGELHGGLTQAQRLESLRQFREQELDILLATDVAARGLDIPDVKTIVNLTMPASMKQYVHRVGRTARAGRAGRSVSLVGQQERAMLRQINKGSMLPLEVRTIPTAVIDRFRRRIELLEPQVDAVFRLEREERELRIAESQLTKSERQMAQKSAPGIGGATSSASAADSGIEDSVGVERPRSWFQTPQQRKRSHEAAKLEPSDRKSKKSMLASGRSDDKKTKKKAGVSAEDRIGKELMKRQLLQAKAAKRIARSQGSGGGNDFHKQQNKKSKNKLQGLNLATELTDTSHKAVKGLRYRAKESLRERGQMQRDREMGVEDSRGTGSKGRARAGGRGRGGSGGRGGAGGRDFRGRGRGVGGSSRGGAGRGGGSSRGGGGRGGGLFRGGGGRGGSSHKRGSSGGRGGRGGRGSRGR